MYYKVTFYYCSRSLITHANHMTVTTSGRFSHDPITKGNINIKLWDLYESLIVYILLNKFQWVHMALAVNRPDVRRFIAWIEPADWNPCLCKLFIVSQKLSLSIAPSASTQTNMDNNSTQLGNIVLYVFILFFKKLLFANPQLALHI